MKGIKKIGALRHQRGSATVVAVTAAAVLLMLCGAILSVALRGKQETTSAISQKQALHAADAGIALAVSELSAGLVVDVGSPVNLGSASAPFAFAGGQYYAQVEANGDGTYDVVSNASLRSESVSVHAVLAPTGGSIYDHAVFAGNDSGDGTYDLEMGGSGPQADDIAGDLYSGGDVSMTEDSVVSGTIRAGGDINGAAGEEGFTQPIPDLAAENYASSADFDVAAMFSSGAESYRYADAGGYAYQLPESSPGHIFRKNPSDRSSDTASTVKDDYFFEDPYEAVSSDRGMDGSDAYRASLSGISGEPGVSSDDKVFYIDGNLWMHNRKGFSLGIKHAERDGVQITFVVKGNIYFADNFFYQDADVDGVAFLAMEDSNVADSGNIYFGDPVFGTLQAMQSYMYAENDFYDLNLDSSGSASVEVIGNMSAGNQVRIQRDYRDSHTKLRVDFDERIMDGVLELPGLPGSGSAAVNKFVVTYWHQIADA